MSSPVAVIDTNALVGGLITGDAQAPTARIVDAMLVTGDQALFDRAPAGRAVSPAGFETLLVAV